MFHPRVQTLTWGMLKSLTKLSPNLIFKQMIPSFTKLDTADVLAAWSDKDKAAFKTMLLHLSSGSGFMLDIEHSISTEILHDILCPTLIVHSKNDNSVDFSHPRHALEHIKAAALFEAQTWGHLIWLGAGSAEVKEKVAGFLRHDI